MAVQYLCKIGSPPTGDIRGSLCVCFQSHAKSCHQRNSVKNLRCRLKPRISPEPVMSTEVTIQRRTMAFRRCTLGVRFPPQQTAPCASSQWDGQAAEVEVILREADIVSCRPLTGTQEAWSVSCDRVEPGMNFSTRRTAQRSHWQSSGLPFPHVLGIAVWQCSHSLSTLCNVSPDMSKSAG